MIDDHTRAMRDGLAESRFTIYLARVYDLLGQVIQVLVDDLVSAGHHTVYWDGRDEAGRQVSSGVYLYKLGVGKFIETRKAVLLR